MLDPDWWLTVVQRVAGRAAGLVVGSGRQRWVGRSLLGRRWGTAALDSLTAWRDRVTRPKGEGVGGGRRMWTIVVDGSGGGVKGCRVCPSVRGESREAKKELDFKFEIWIWNPNLLHLTALIPAVPVEFSNYLFCYLFVDDFSVTVSISGLPVELH
ncbi:hypothetical protein AAHA92_09397 [Salvia divinorum]|uniref:Uncharacterized protein n=1 Tax=Salvia divinorum TaxID=28513 RepID=A0ABD1HR63_SALDI